MDDVSDLVARQYAEHCYPEPLTDLSEIEPGQSHYGDPRWYSVRLWPEGRPRRDLRILAAGCGTMQAAVLAYNNPECTVVGVDVSEPSLAHERFLQDKHRLTNLRLYRGDVREAAALGREFDLIVCTGVLHHLKSPGEGLDALRSVLAPQGAMFLMVYAMARRVGVYLLQDAFRRLGVQQDEAGVSLVRSTLGILHPQHYVHWYRELAHDLVHDSGIVDTFLHPQDRAYTVPEVLELVEGAGLRFQSWLDDFFYNPDAHVPPQSPLWPALRKVSIREQWAVVENLTACIGCHYLLACRKERDEGALVFDFEGPDWPSYVPTRPPGVRVVEPARAGSGALVKLARGDLAFELTPSAARLFEGIDGEHTIAELLQRSSPGSPPTREALAFARQVFERMARRGHVFLSKVPVGDGSADGPRPRAT